MNLYEALVDILLIAYISLPRGYYYTFYEVLELFVALFSLFISTNSTKNRPLSLFVIHFPKKEKEKLGWGMGGVLEDQVFFLVELDDLSLIRKAAVERLLHAYTKLREICSKV